MKNCNQVFIVMALEYGVVNLTHHTFEGEFVGHDCPSATLQGYDVVLSNGYRAEFREYPLTSKIFNSKGKFIKTDWVTPEHFAGL